MKITGVEAIPVSIPIKSFRDAYNTFTTCPAVITKIQTSDGITGYGEASAIVPEIFGETVESITAMINKSLSKIIMGQDPTDIGSLYRQMDRQVGRAPSAKTGIDLALYDILGKSVGKPVYNLIGGRVFESVKAAFEIGIKNPTEMAEESLSWVKKGLRVVKLKAGSGDLDGDLKRIKAVSEAVGDDILLRVDPNTGWSVTDCARAGPTLRDINLEYLEQPIPGWDIEGLAEVRRVTGVPIEADESVWTVQDVVKIGQKRAADVINLKIPKVGGLYKAKKMAAVAEGFGMTCMGGAEGEVASAIAAKLHLAISTQNALNASDLTELRWMEDWLLTKPIVMNNQGCVQVPDGPGLGVEPDPRKLKQLTIRI